MVGRGEICKVIPGDPPIPVTLRRSARARRITLRVSSLDGRVTLTAPPNVPDALALDFALARADWVRGRRAGLLSPVSVELGVALPVSGVARRIVAGSRSSLEAPDRIEVRVGGAVGPQVARLLQAEARCVAGAAVERHSEALGRCARRLTLRDTRSRWGSCSERGDLMLSWRLLLAPPEILDYVVAHEVAHLEQMNHSRHFWAVVARLAPDYGEARGWLRRHGASLHRWRFAA